MSESKVALVTGAGSGIGKAVATTLVAAGWNTVFTGRRLDRLEEAAKAAESAGTAKAVAIACDVTKADQVDELFAKIEQQFGRLDLLFNNAGMGAKGAMIDEIPVEVWKEVVDVNLTGSFLCARGAFRMMRNQKPQGGRIINNGSISAHAPRPGTIPYTATKHAITGLTKTLALDGRPFDIACGQIDIGNAATSMTSDFQVGALQAHGGVAAEPTMGLENVVKAVLFMADLPLEANVQFLTVMATKMPFIGRG